MALYRFKREYEPIKLPEKQAKTVPPALKLLKQRDLATAA